MKDLRISLNDFLVCGMAGAVWLAGASRALADDWPKLSPFTSVKVTGQSAHVTFQGRPYDLVSINGQTTGQLLDFCRKTYESHDNLWEKRFTEDLVEVLDRAGHPMAADNTVTLVLKGVDDGKEVTIERAPMTKDNRRAIMLERHGEMKKPDDRAGPRSDAASNSDLSPALDQFERLLLDRWSYYAFSQADFKGAISRLRQRLPGMDTGTFGLELQRIIALSMDGHSGIGGAQWPGGFLPFLMEPAGGRYVAFKSDRSALLDAGHPYVTKLDGREISDWLKSAAGLVPKGSPQYIQHESLRVLRNIQFIRHEMGLPSSDELSVELQSADGNSRTEIHLPIANQLPKYGIWPAGDSHLLPDNIGYLRIPEMNEKAVAAIRAWMPRFRQTKGLIVDVRDNGGGSREALRWLYSYLASPSDPPRVVNAAVYRLARDFKKDHLAERFMYLETDPVWNPAARAAIATFKRGFQAERKPPEGEFSDWHYLVLSPLREPSIYHYDHPVIVLMNAKCFSATDIFLSSLKGLRNVTLMGASSGGGSALALEETLAGTSLAVRLASMISYQADGRLFDGHGITPDIVVQPEPGYFVGGEDNTLREAISVIENNHLY